jgi:hypothetical protein
MRSLSLRLVLLAVSLPLAACTVEAQPAPVAAYSPPPPPVYAPPPPPAVMVVHAPPPALRVEVMPPRPPGGYVWRPGHWEWTGNGYVWIHGHYVLRQPGWHGWVNGFWAPSGIWIAGHWN